ncbi:PEP-CTERM sorting domain-containing protein [Piscinibacter sp.]|uniref:PEP-CTERM sorting domain-containing protein n=1 Tax=Piscinibacter sp. TaxID=1903157 RepID=UPI002CD9FCF4|nr:PEP-CTERM sorting domain-containing protein [Albitalea sp.]HUG21885.1 PEP-CTERM sorting domain-containing protein [Albitalea sp.]
MRSAAAAIALASCFAAPASANESFLFKVTGSVVHSVDWWECECDIGEETSPWTGWMQVTTSGASDGTYTGDDLLDLTLNTNWASFSVDGNGFGDSILNAWVSVTLLSGDVVSIDGSVEYGVGPYELVKFESDRLRYVFEGAHHIGPSEGTAIFTAIPEPSTYALLLAGLAVVVGSARRRRTTSEEVPRVHAPRGVARVLPTRVVH